MVFIKSLLFSLLLLFGFNAYAFSVAPIHGSDTNRYDLYGPAIIPYCDGFIETYVKRVWGSYQLMVKATPPKGESWTINNSHVLIVDASNKDKPLDYNDFYEINSKQSKETQLQFNIKGYYQNRINQFGVSFKNFDGCSKEEQKGSILKISSKF